MKNKQKKYLTNKFIYFFGCIHKMSFMPKVKRTKSQKYIGNKQNLKFRKVFPR